MRFFILGILSPFTLMAISDFSTTYEVLEDRAALPILTPSLAARKIAKIRLSNNLEAYIISDPDCGQAAASLSVEAGSWNDPKEYPGMAHFLEHMLFMGTKAYPHESEYMSFISDHGGMLNAYTAPDRTVYMFSINHDSFTGALDRFAHFFIDPLFLPSCIGRELNAVHNEHAKNIQNDLWREYMILKETGNPVHPNAGFSTGNSTTLANIPQEALKKWYRENYSSNRMHLVLLSNLPLDELIDAAVEKFSAVENHNLVPDRIPDELLSKDQKGHFIYIEPVQDIKNLSLLWQLPVEYVNDLNHHAVDLIAYALNQGGDNSLLNSLKKDKIAESLYVYKDNASRDQGFFNISIDLTEYGLHHVETAIERCFEALANLEKSGIPASLYREYDQMARLNYEYQSREEAFSFVRTMGHMIVDEKIETFPERHAVSASFNPAFTKKLLSYLTPESGVYIIKADPKLTGVEMTSREKWMDAEYAVKAVEPQLLKQWAQTPLDSQIGLPAPNLYIPEHLNTISNLKNDLPILIAENPSYKVYLQQDTIYQVPETTVIFNIKTPLLDGSASSKAFFDIYQQSLNEQLYANKANAKRAGIYSSFAQQDLNLVLTVTGFSEKLPLFLETICHAIANVQTTKESFELYKKAQLADYENSSKVLPLMQARQLLSSIIYNDAPLADQKAAALKSLTYESFTQQCNKAFKKTHINGMIYGSITLPAAQELWDKARSFLIQTPYPSSEHIEKSFLTLPANQGPFSLKMSTAMQGNGALLMIEQGSFSLEKRAAQQILSKALQEAFYDTLRTKQQTGYIAQSGCDEVADQLSHWFAVQSITHTPTELLCRFELFLEDFIQNIRDRIPLERFETLQGMLINTLQTPPENMRLKAVELNAFAFERQGDFDWITKRVKSLKTLTYEEMIVFARESFSRQNHRRLAILAEGVLPPDSAFTYQNLPLESLESCKRSIP